VQDGWPFFFFGDETGWTKKIVTATAPHASITALSETPAGQAANRRFPLATTSKFIGPPIGAAHVAGRQFRRLKHRSHPARRLEGGHDAQSLTTR
jgi:hypothetical protein